MFVFPWFVIDIKGVTSLIGMTGPIIRDLFDLSFLVSLLIVVPKKTKTFDFSVQ